MEPRLEPIRDVVPVGYSAPGKYRHWESTGDDPSFLISLRMVRRRFVLIHLESADESIDPIFYVNYGRGFSERHTIVVNDGKRHVLLIDVGVVGAVRALRLDPATFPTRFSCRIRSFSKREDAERKAEDWVASAPETQLQRFGNLNRLWLRGSRLIPSFGSAVGDHVKHIYALARTETASRHFDGAGVWLSIVVPVYNPPARYLDDVLASFRRQDMAGVELILSDDASTSAETRAWLKARHGEPYVKIVLNANNQGIAVTTNAGLSVAEGAWVALLDHDDLIAPFALKMIWGAFQQNPQAQFLYTDELVVDDRLRPTGYMLKPAYDPVLLSGVNYINHFSIYRRKRLEQIGRLRLGFEGSQDYDLVLRYLDGLPDDAVLHLPYPAYWWRRTGQTYSRQFLDRATASARRSLTERYSGAGAMEVEPAITPTLHRVVFGRGDAPPAKVSIIIPTKNAHALVSRVLSDIYEKTDYPNFEVIVVDNGTTDAAVLSLYETMRRRHANFSAHVETEAFNFSRSVNKGFALATGDHVLLLNNDVEVIEPGWLTEMVSCLDYDGVGIVGAKLLFPNGTLQHAGVIVGFGGLAGHWFLGKPRNFGGPMNRLHIRASMACVTGAVMLISGACRARVGDFDDINFAVAYNDVDYCVRAYKHGFRSVWTPFATLYHRESVSRGSEKSAANRVRFEMEKANLKRVHDTAAFMDPAISPMYSRNHSTPALRSVTHLQPARPWFSRKRS